MSRIPAIAATCTLFLAVPALGQQGPVDGREEAVTPMPSPSVHAATRIERGQESVESRARAPRPASDKSRWFRSADYPPRAFSYNMDGTGTARLHVNAAGRVEKCEMTRSFGWQPLNEAFCRTLTRTAKFHPALDEEGNAVAGNYLYTRRIVLRK